MASIAFIHPVVAYFRISTYLSDYHLWSIFFILLEHVKIFKHPTNLSYLHAYNYSNGFVILPLYWYFLSNLFQVFH